MRKIFLLTTSLMFCFTMFSQNNIISNYEIKVKIKNTENDTLYLANYLGKKLYYYDTAYADNKGITVFKGNKIPAGIYAVVTKGPKYFEIVVNEPKIELETSTDDFTNNMVVKNSPENKVFYEFITYVVNRRKEAYPLNEKLKDTTLSQTEKDDIYNQLKKIDEDVAAFQKEFDKKYYPNYFSATLLSLNFELEIPEEIDSTERYFYYKEHFLDRIDFNDDRFVRSPAFHNKLEKYFNQVLPQIPDTIIAEAKKIIGNIKDEKSDTWKYVVHYITNTYEQSKLMGMDKVLVFMAQNYYCSTKPSKAYWMPEDKLKELCEKTAIGQYLLIGEKAPNLILQDTTESQWINLHEVAKTKWTIVIFYDPNCGHCKKEIPLFKEFYDKYKETYDLTIIGVNTELENKDWKKFIREQELNGWIHISDNPEIHNHPEKYLNKTTIESLNFRRTYDIFSTPQVYILDKNKIIKAKKIGAEQLEDLFEKLNN